MKNNLRGGRSLGRLPSILLKTLISICVFQNLQTTKNPINQIFMRFNDGAGTRIRTVDLLITSQLLYQLSYAGNVE